MTNLRNELTAAVSLPEFLSIVDGRPRMTVDLGGNPGPVPVPGAGTPEVVRIAGYDRGVLVAARTFVRKGTALRLRTTLEELS
jgi:hypothetical protein